MSRQLESTERLEGESLQEWLGSVVIPDDLRNFVQQWQKAAKQSSDIQSVH